MVDSYHATLVCVNICSPMISIEKIAEKSQHDSFNFHLPIILHGRKLVSNVVPESTKRKSTKYEPES